MSDIKYRRILLKLSGEALMGDGDFGIDPAIVGRLASEIAELVQAGVEVGLVIGGGNLFRGAGLAESGLNRVRGDHMGMLATVMNALAMQDSLEKLAVPAETFSAIPMDAVCESYSRRRVDAWLRSGGVALLAAGTGNPFFTTDSAAGLRAIEIGAELLIKATKVDGVYSADPLKNPSAQFYSELTYDQALAERLAVMDTAAIVLCRDHRLPMRIMNIYEAGAILRAVQGQPVGSLVHSGEA